MRNDTRRGAADASGEVAALAGGGVGMGAVRAESHSADAVASLATVLEHLRPPLSGGAALSMHRSTRSLRP